MEDFTTTPETKLEGVDLTAPAGTVREAGTASTGGDGIDPAFAAAMTDDGAAARDAYLAGELEKLGYPPAGGPEDANPAEKAIFALTAVSVDREELRDQLAAAHSQLADVTAERDAALAAGKKAKAAVTKAATPARPRKLGRIEAKGDAREAIANALADGQSIEIAFSDGSHEIAGIDPVAVTGEAWTDHVRGRMLDRPVTVTGPDDGTSVKIDGYVLLIDGKPFAYCQRSEPIAIAPGQTVQLRDDIFF